MRIRRATLSFIVVILIAVCPCTEVTAASLYVSAESAALMSADTGRLIYGQNESKRLSMASTTKIMTSLIALETGSPDMKIVVDEQMVSIEGTSMGLLPGDTVTLYALVCGMLMSSGNDAANTVATVLGGNAEGFARMMNERAREIGMSGSNFVTASGLDDDGHYSTARDMALLGCEAIKNPLFASICSKSRVTVEYGNPPYRRTLYNHNRLLWQYEFACGIKTGFTKKSGRCLVSAAKKDGVTLVAVTLNAPDDWNDHIRMFDYGFSVVRATKLDSELAGIRLPVTGGTVDSVAVSFADEPSAVLRSDSEVTREILIKQFEYAPVRKGEIVGRAVYYQDGAKICESEIITDEAAQYQVGIKNKETESDKEKMRLKRFFDNLIAKIKGVFN